MVATSAKILAFGRVMRTRGAVAWPALAPFNDKVPVNRATAAYRQRAAV